MSAETRGHRVMLVDDSEIVLAVVGETLSAAGYELVTASSGAEALQAAADGRYDLFIIDVVMPGMDGLELVRRLRQRPETGSTPITMLSQLSGTEKKVEGLEAGADDFLSKGATEAELLARVRSLIAIGTVRQAASSDASGDRAAERFESEGATVLIVHHDGATRQLLQRALRSRGTDRVQLAQTVDEALVLLSQPAWDLVLVEASSYLGDGSPLREALDAIAEVPAVVLADACPSAARRVAAFDSGVDEYVPVDMAPGELTARLHAALRRGQRHRRARTDRDRALRAAATDVLTGLHNRAHFDRALEQELRRCQAEGSELSLVMVDLDRFKQVNDVHGHQAGDRVLAEIGARISGALRETDVGARYGGEELAVILPRTTRDNATKVAERLRQRIAAAPIELPSGSRLRVTASLGLASVPGDAVSAEELIHRADQSLYRAKAAGRNRLVAWTTDAPVGTAAAAELVGPQADAVSQSVDVASTLRWLLGDGSFDVIREGVTMLAESSTPSDPAHATLQWLQRACDEVASLVGTLLPQEPVGCLSPSLLREAILASSVDRAAAR